MCDEDPYILPDQDLSLWSQGGHLGQQVQRANWQVANVSTPANYFHLLRRQLHRSFRKVGGVGRWGGGGRGGGGWGAEWVGWVATGLAGPAGACSHTLASRPYSQPGRLPAPSPAAPDRGRPQEPAAPPRR